MYSRPVLNLVFDTDCKGCIEMYYALNHYSCAFHIRFYLIFIEYIPNKKTLEIFI